MHPAKDLFDYKILRQRRRRTENADASAWFLHEYAAAQVSERLKDINRSFTDSAIVGWKADLWAKELGICARCVEDVPVLDLPEGKCDLIINALCLHWSNDPVGQLIQMRRALKHDGMMIAVLFAGQTLHQLRDAFSAGEAEIEGGISPRIAPMADVRSLGGLLQRAGFALPVVDAVQVETSYRSPLHLMRELRSMGETNVLSDRRKSHLKRTTLDAVLNHYHANYEIEGGRVATTFDLAFLTGWRPSESQQKPLRPGSATTLLADALRTDISRTDSD